MKIEELFLSKEQMDNLKELGIDTRYALFSRVEESSGKQFIKYRRNHQYEEKEESVYSLGELLYICKRINNLMHEESARGCSEELNIELNDYDIRYTVYKDTLFGGEGDTHNLLLQTYHSLEDWAWKQGFKERAPFLPYIGEKPYFDNPFLSKKQMSNLRSMGVNIRDATFYQIERDGVKFIMPTEEVVVSNAFDDGYTYTVGELFEKIFKEAESLDSIGDTFRVAFGDGKSHPFEKFKTKQDAFSDRVMIEYDDLSKREERFKGSCDTMNDAFGIDDCEPTVIKGYNIKDAAYNALRSILNIKRMERLKYT